jgi:pilus assembly protein Flp/PilA
MKMYVRHLVRQEEGQDLIEYALLAALIAVALIATLSLVATESSNIFNQVITELAS